MQAKRAQEKCALRAWLTHPALPEPPRTKIESAARADPAPPYGKLRRLSPEEYAERQEAAGEFAWPETEEH